LINLIGLLKWLKIETGAGVGCSDNKKSASFETQT